MIPETLTLITQELPYRLRSEIEGYVNAVDAVVPEIAVDLDAEVSQAARERFLFLVGIRRLWGSVDGSHWLASNATAVLERTEVTYVSAGATFLGPGSEFSEELRRLRFGLQEILIEHEILEPIMLGHVADVMFWVLTSEQ